MDTINTALKQAVQRQIKGKVYPSAAALAKLRRGLGKKLGEAPELLAYVLPDEDITPYENSEKFVEKAMYTTLTLYAWHQQGHKGQCMSENENSFGKAIRKLVRSDKSNESAVIRRFNQVLTAKSLTELAVHARGLVGLLKRDSISVNYPELAVDFYWFQQENFRRNVLLKWGRDFYMYARKDDQE